MLSYLNPLPQVPKYKGPYQVGSTEYEIPVSEIESSSVTPDPTVTTVKFRIFYPTISSAKSKQSIPWLPRPQRTWNQAYAQFMGLSERRASWMSYLPSILNHATIPAVQNAPLLENFDSKQRPVLIFSHGLGGSYNTYSSLVGSLASCGIVCIAPEHRDGSAPISLIKSSPNKVETVINYKKVSHSPTVEVLNARNVMLRVRLWELELIYTAVEQINQGKRFTNLADIVSEVEKMPNFSSSLDLRPGRVTWAGHSFGSATMVQFIKSTYYHKDAPEVKKNGEWNMTPLYTPSIDGKLVEQITPESPVALCDLWTMPLRGEPTQWLWIKPLPCYERRSTSTAPNVISIMSAEFYKWKDLRNRTIDVLSSNPTEALATIEKSISTDDSSNVSNRLSSNLSKLPSSKQEQPPPVERELNEPAEPELTPVPTASTETMPEQHNLSTNHNLTSAPQSSPSTRSPSPANRANSTPSFSSHTSSHSSLRSPPSTITPAQLYMISSSAHLSQSDFGPLFPNLTRYFMKALDPEKTIELNVRGIVTMMRGCGLDVENITGEKGEDHILDKEHGEERWERVPIP